MAQLSVLQGNAANGTDGCDPEVARIPIVPAPTLLPNHCGWLYKKRKLGGLKSTFGSPQKRWCCIKGGVFYYYLSHKSTKQQGSFYLSGYEAEVVTTKKDSIDKLWFRVTKLGARSYEFQTTDKVTRADWIDAIAKGASFAPCLGLPSDETQRNMAARRLPSVPNNTSPALQLHNENGEFYDDTNLPAAQNEEMYDDVVVDPSTAPQDPILPSPPGNPTMHPMPPTAILPDPSVDDGIGLDDSVEYDDVAVKELDSDSEDSYIYPSSGPRPSHNMVKKKSTHSVDEGFVSQASGKSSGSEKSGRIRFRSLDSPLPPIPPEVAESKPVVLNTRPQQPPEQWKEQRMPQASGCPKNKSGMKKLIHDSDIYLKLYFVLCDFRPKSSDELSLRRGEVIKVTNKQFDVHQWWTGRKAGKIGLVPKTYLKPVYRPR